MCSKSIKLPYEFAAVKPASEKFREDLRPRFRGVLRALGALKTLLKNSCGREAVAENQNLAAVEDVVLGSLVVVRSAKLPAKVITPIVPEFPLLRAIPIT